MQRTDLDLDALLRLDGGSIGYFRLAERLLRWCRENRRAVDEARLQWAGHNEWVRLVDSLRSVWAGEPTRAMRASAALRRSIADLVRSSALPPEAALRAVAESIDAARRPRFVDEFLLEYRSNPIKVVDGDAYPRPVPRHPALGSAHEPGPGTPAFRLNYRADQLPGIWLAPDTEQRWGVAVHYDVRMYEHLGQLVAATSGDADGHPADVAIATCHPDRELADFIRPPVADYGGSFFGATPAPGHSASYRSLLASALDGGAQVVVFPELTGGFVAGEDDPFEIARAEALATPHRGRLIVAGSRHEGAPGSRANVLRVFAGSRETRHRKIQPASMSSPGGTPAIERLDPAGVGSSVTVVLTKRFAIVPLICSDLLFPSISEVLAAVGANLVLVPAATPTVGPFDAPMYAALVANQGTGIVANGPALWDAVRAPLGVSWLAGRGRSSDVSADAPTWFRGSLVKHLEVP